MIMQEKEAGLYFIENHYQLLYTYNREADIWHNSLGELTLYQLTNEAKDVTKNNKFIDDDIVFVKR